MIVSVPIGSTIATGHPSLMAVMAAAARTRSPAVALAPMAAVTDATMDALCLVYVIVICMSLRATSGYGPGGSRE